MNKKGQIFDQLSALGVGIAALSITLVITFLIISNGRSNITTNNQACALPDYYTYSTTTKLCCNTTAGDCIGVNSTTGFTAAYNATQTLGVSVSGIPGWVPLIVIAVIGAILLGLVAMFRNK